MNNIMKYRSAKLRTISILKLYAKGFNIKRIAYELNISEQTVTLRLKEIGIDWRDHKIDKDRIYDIILDLEEALHIVNSPMKDPWNTSNWR